MSANTKQHETDHDAAKIKWVITFTRFFLDIVNLRTFAGLSTHAFDTVAPIMRERGRALAKKALDNPVVEECLAKWATDPPQEAMARMLDAFAQRSVRLARQTAKSASLVFAHSMLDELLSECCSISSQLNPKDWLRFVGEKRVLLRDLKAEDLEWLQRQKVEEFILDLRRQSILRKFDCLHVVCVPKLAGKERPSQGFKTECLKEFDDARHKIVHGRSFSKRILNIDQHVATATNTGLVALALVNEAYNLESAIDALQPDSSRLGRRVLRLCAAVRKEFPEFLEFLKQQTDARETHAKIEKQ